MGDSGTATTRERPLIGAAGQLRALRRRFMAHRDYFSKQGELKNGLDMLSEVMGRTADRLSRP